MTAAATSALIVLGMQRHAANTHEASPGTMPHICALIEQARSDQDQIVFVQHVSDATPEGSEAWRLAEPLVPVFPDWVVQAHGATLFDGSHLAAQLKAAGIRRLTIAGGDVDAVVLQAQALGFSAVPAVEIASPPRAFA